MSWLAKQFSSLTQDIPTPGQKIKRIEVVSTTSEAQADKIIVVLGVTGSGKSSFVKAITNLADVDIGHSLYSGQSPKFLSLPVKTLETH